MKNNVPGMLLVAIILPLATLLACCATEPVLGADDKKIAAFPGANGAGMFASGGRSGSVYVVTNLNANGPGSLADAVSKPNRIIVFAVSGIIDLAQSKKGKGGKIVADQPNITIAGQTAPGEGICIKGGCLAISAGNVVVRHIRSRRGWNWEGDSGDAIEVKPSSIGERKQPIGQSKEVFDRIKAKKEERGKFIHEFANIANVIIDHCSASWATDENLTVTRTDRSTISWCIAAEGCDYANPKQTPPNHSEGSLWGSPMPNGRSTMHHMLYAHNRLRNPRTTGGADISAVLTLYNSVVYDWSEYATHTGSERVLLNWLNNYYKSGPSTLADIRTHAFEFHGDPGARVYASGNFIEGSPAATANNKLAVFHNQKFKKVTEADREKMKADAPFGELPAHVQKAEDALASVLADAGATLPARDAVDLRIVDSVRAGTGRVIAKETDLPAEQRWPVYYSLPAPKDSDGDGIPDYWEEQFGLNKNDAKDSMQIGFGGYANIEHYINNTNPRGGTTSIVSISAPVSRTQRKEASPGVLKVTRTGSTAEALTVTYTVSGTAERDKDFEKLSGTVTIPAGAASATITVSPQTAATANGEKTVAVTLNSGKKEYHAGCPVAALVVIRD